MQPELTLIAAKQHIADLRRAACHNRLVHSATGATGGHAVAALLSFLRRFVHHGRLEPREDQAGCR